MTKVPGSGLPYRPSFAFPSEKGGDVDLSRVAQPTRGADGRLPASTNIAALGLSPEGAAELTPAAAKLTKANLEALRGKNGEQVRERLGLTLEDISSIRSAFSAPVSFRDRQPEVEAKQEGGINIACCCCTPCCCAAAVIVPVQPIA